MRVNPIMRRVAVAVLRRVAMTGAADPARSRWASSCMVTSRTWWRASMSQWLRAAVAMRVGVPPRSAPRLVMPRAAAAGRCAGRGRCAR